MTRAIEIRGYVVGFGDCILLRLPDGTQTRHILIDFGRAPNDPSSLERFPAIAENIERRCNGHLDLLVVTHEHLDHLEGFYRQRDIFNRMTVDRVWMGLPSHPDYYKKFPKARLQKKMRDGLRGFMESAQRNGIVMHPSFQSLVQNNIANRDRVDYLRQLGQKQPAYLARGKSEAASRAFKNIRIRVLAPEPDVSVYYTASSRAEALSSAFSAANNIAGGDVDPAWQFPNVARATSNEWGGLSRSDFERLRRLIREDGVAMARFIDRAQNNTSLCFLIEASGKRLLLPGDAELESWEIMKRKCAAELGKPVDFLKVSHHGSHNGTPTEMLDTLLPVRRKAKAQALVSTKHKVYGTKNPVPDQDLIKDLKSRCRRLVTTDGKLGTHVDLEV
jgi:hypothetical protein